MIKAIQVNNYRALRSVRCDLNRFHVLVGANASGKSTLFDAFLFLRDIVILDPERAVHGDARLRVPMRAVRARELTWQAKGGPIEIAIEVALPEEVKTRLAGSYDRCRYEIGIRVEPEIAIEDESLFLCPERDATGSPQAQIEIFPREKSAVSSPITRKKPNRWRKVLNKVGESGNDYFRSETSGWNNLFRLGHKRSALANLPEDTDKFPAATWLKSYLTEGICELKLDAEKLRLPCPPGAGKSLATDGSNLPLLVHELRSNASTRKRYDQWLEHVRTALDDLADLSVVERPEDKHQYLNLEHSTGHIAPSWVLSDGTLRLLALTLLAYLPSPPAILLIEEPENGIHPQAVQTVVQSISSIYDSQVFCATHSPVILATVETSQLLCFGKTRNGQADIVSGTDHPGLREWQGAVHLGDIFAAGILS